VLHHARSETHNSRKYIIIRDIIMDPQTKQRKPENSTTASHSSSRDHKFRTKFPVVNLGTFLFHKEETHEMLALGYRLSILNVHFSLIQCKEKNLE
jgi:hypothetical protein